MSPAHGRICAAQDYQPARWLPGPHLPTVWANACRRAPRPVLSHERLELADGDFLDLAWTPPAPGPTVLVLHGLEGGAASPYARAMLAALTGAGYRGVLMHFRGCSGELNRLDRSYHSGDTADAAHVVERLRAREGRAPAAAIGYSLGGNVLLKWLGELGAACPLATAVAVSVPFDLAACADRLNRGASRYYQWRLVSSMRDKFKAKFRDRPPPLAVTDVDRLSTFRSFDDAITAPLHGFRDADDYYARASSRAFLRHIAVPTLILHAVDDPFVPASAIPRADELSPPVTLELARHGGHVGFVSGPRPGRIGYWLESRILRHLDATLAHRPR